MTKSILVLNAFLVAGLTVTPVAAQTETPAPEAEAEAVEEANGPKIPIPPMIPPPVGDRPALPPMPAPPPPRAPAKTVPVPVTELVGSETKPDWLQSPTFFLPGRVESGEGEFLENQTMVEAPLVWAFAGRLGAAVTIDAGGKKVVLNEGDILPQVILKTETGVDDRYLMVCTRSRILQEEKNAGFLGKLTNDLVDSMRDAQWCLQDSDGDGNLDLAVVLNGGAPITKAADITPVPFEEVKLEPIPGGEDKLTFGMIRVGKKDLTVSMTITQMGKEMKFDSLSSGFYRASKLTSVRYIDSTATVLGVQFKVLDADRKANKASLQWKSVARHRDEFVVIPTKLYTTTRYGY